MWRHHRWDGVEEVRLMRVDVSGACKVAVGYNLRSIASVQQTALQPASLKHISQSLIDGRDGPQSGKSGEQDSWRSLQPRMSLAVDVGRAEERQG